MAHGTRQGARPWPRFELRHGEWLLLGVALVWGSSYTAVKVALAHVGPLQFLVLRLTLTALVMAPALALWRPGRDWWHAGLLSGANLLAILLCETAGVSLTSAANAAFLIGTCTVVTPFVEWAMTGRHPGRQVMLAALLSLAGAWLLSGAHASALAAGRGELLVLLAAVLRALMACMLQRLRGEVPFNAAAMTATQMLVAAAGAWLVHGAMRLHGGPALTLPSAPAFWWAMAWLVGACTVMAFVVQNYAIPRAGPSRVALLLGSEPLFGALFAVLVLDEALGPAALLGGALIVVSAWTVLGAPRRTARNPESGAPAPHRTAGNRQSVQPSAGRQSR